jgi:hypothetical protein
VKNGSVQADRSADRGPRSGIFDRIRRLTGEMAEWSKALPC